MFLADEGFNGNILRRLRRVVPSLDILRVREVGLHSTPDPTILEWAAAEGRTIMTHDTHTMIGYAAERVRQNLPMPGLISCRN